MEQVKKEFLLECLDKALSLSRYVNRLMKEEGCLTSSVP